MPIMRSTPWRTIVIATVLLHLSFPTEVYSSANSDRIIRLPGQPPVNFQQYAGYITVDKKRERALFYYFVEAETEPSSKPLVIWFNGGPGCSSVGAGAFSEHGPFRPSGSVLVRNEYSWNTEANMLYVEMPAGVGFSYSRNMSDYKGMNDEKTAKDNLVFLRRWFVKFPEYKSRDLFITGESYAGHYIPQLAELLIRANKQRNEFNLKGIALGNPLLEFFTDRNSRTAFLWSHGLISDPTYRVFSNSCNWSRYLSELFRGKEMAEKIDVCVLKHETPNYLNRKDVQNALHARLVGVSKWDLCNNKKTLDYNMLDTEIPTISLLGSIVKSGIPVLVYSGDQDANVPLIGTRTLVHGLVARLRLHTTVTYRVWFAGGQVGGWTVVYGDALSFATIRGAAHEAPFSHPQRALVLFKAFLQGKPLPETP